MHINSVQNFYNKTTFKSWKREVIKPYKGIVNRNDTCFFREEEFFPKLLDFLKEKFINTKKINTYCYGCSDGSEPFSIAMHILSKNDENFSKKFLPIIAKDIDEVAIYKAINNNYEITEVEKKYIDLYTQNQFNKFFYNPYGEPKGKEKSTVFVKNILYDNVNFNTGDILKDYKNISPKNTILFARNFWPYIDYQIRKDFFKNIYQHLDENCYFITGKFDHDGICYQLNCLDSEILQAGFKRTPIKYVYVKE